MNKDLIREAWWWMKDDALKSRIELIPWDALLEIGKILWYWANKYEANSWQKLENFEDRYTWALLRHLYAWRSWEDIDKESWKYHLAHMATNAIFLLWKQLQDWQNNNK